MLEWTDINVPNSPDDHALDNHIERDRSGRGENNLLCRAVQQFF